MKSREMDSIQTGPGAAVVPRVMRRIRAFEAEKKSAEALLEPFVLYWQGSKILRAGTAAGMILLGLFRIVYGPWLIFTP